MTQAKTEPDRILVNFLRSNLSDVNGSRSGEWVFSNFPRVQNLGDAQFPRVAVSILGESAESLGLYDDNQRNTVTFQIDIIAKKGKVYSVTTTDEALGSISSGVNSDRLVYAVVPNTVTNIKHDGTSYGTVTAVDTDADFTAPASLPGDEVEWSKSTGNLNFNSADVTTDDGEAITSTSVVNLEGKKLCQYLARKVLIAIRNNWRTDSTLNGLYYPVFLANNPVPFDEDLGIFRQTVDVQFNGYNVGEGL